MKQLSKKTVCATESLNIYDKNEDRATGLLPAYQGKDLGSTFKIPASSPLKS